MRKTASDFGWDWVGFIILFVTFFLNDFQGPAFVPSGIFKPAFLITLQPSSGTDLTSEQPATSSITAGSAIFIEEKSVEIFREGQKPSIGPDQSADWVVNVTLALRSADVVDHPSMVIAFPELNVTSDALPLLSFPGDTSISTLVSASFTVPNGIPKLWYPHNLGSPQRYNVTVTLLPSNVSFTTTTGFRTIVLVQSPYSQADVESRGITPGDQFHFEVNGKAFYSLGTNIIPFDPFYSRMTTEQVRWVIESAVMSGQNMVRPW